ncbi:MAG: orotidine-5'-phosphate decarboxylase [Gammaproteobacteria bacterium]|nr:orotidine-5'-phosphate decarboxylase [Gammaproteobacteria bacterium]
MKHARMRYQERATYCKNPLAKNLFLLLDDKKTNLALSADVTTADALLKLAEETGPDICVFKTHIDIIEDFHPDLTHELQAIAKKHRFYLFEDRKFADIGNTVKHQYEGGIYRIADWADIINAHSLPGPGIIAGLAEAGLKKQRGLLMLAEMSSENNLFNADYTERTLRMAEAHPEFVIGYISQQKLSNEPQWLYMTPGIQLTAGTDALGQQYNTPESAILEKGTDIIIVGRGIVKATDPKTTAQKYRAAGWEAYEKALSECS